MKKIIKSALGSVFPIEGLKLGFNFLRRSETVRLTLIFYFMVSSIIPVLLTLGLIISFILGGDLDLNWFIDSIRSYYWDGEVLFTTGISAWRGHLLLLFLSWLFSVIIQD